MEYRSPNKIAISDEHVLLIQDAIVGCILGTSVGDALGLPYEGLKPETAKRLLGIPNRYRFFFGRGMVSDDTEHTCMVAQSLIESGCDVEVFTRSFARRLRWWMLAFPAGVGKATALSCMKLWLGADPRKSGIFSAGNGPAMRASIFGAAIEELPTMLSLVRASTRLTHTDPKAEFGAIAVALAARESRQNLEVDSERWLTSVRNALADDGLELVELLQRVIQSVNACQSTIEFSRSLGLDRGVTGYTYHTVPVAVHAWLSSPRDFRSATMSTIECGGDADTTGAIVGGIVGSGVGREGIPHEWIDGILEWPRSVPWMIALGSKLAQTVSNSQRAIPPHVNPIAILVRNVLFLFVVLFHGFRRLIPL